MFEGLRGTATKLAGVFRKSRDTWKRRATEKQRRLKASLGKIRDLIRSRDQWKAEAKQLQEQLRQFEAHPGPEVVMTAPATPAVVGANRGHGELAAPPFCPHHGAKASRSV